jgi:uncharacterized protein YeaO (DUF488 family)
LAYFINKLCGCEYAHDTYFAPDRELLDNYKKGNVTWVDYEVQFNEQMNRKDIVAYFTENYGKYDSVCLLCSEDMPKQCHRRLLAEKITNTKGGDVKHL